MSFFQKGKKYLVAGILLLAVLAGLVVYTVYMSDIKTALGEDSYALLDKLTQQSINLVNEKINGDFKNLSLRARAIRGLGLLDSEAVKSYFFASVEEGHSQRMILSSPNGESYSSDGLTGNIAQNEGFQHAMSGEQYVSNEQDALLATSGRVVQISVPIQDKDGVVVGVLSCIHSADNYRKLMEVSEFGNTGHSYIVNPTGAFVIGHPDLEGSQLSVDNIAIEGKELDDLKAAMQKGESGTLQYEGKQGGYQYLSYKPLGFNDWYLVFSIGQEQVARKTVETYTLISIVTAIIFLLLIALLILLVSIQWRAKMQMMRKAYYDSLTSLANGELLRKCFEKLPAGGRGYGYLHLNVQNFKQANKSFGYDAGNHLLVDIAMVLLRHTGKDEVACRLRSDTFVLLLRMGEQADFEKRMEKIMRELEAIKVTDGDVVFAYHCTFCCAIYEITGKEPSFDAIADIAGIAYTMIKQQKKTYGFFNAGMQEGMRIRNTLLAGAKEGIEKREIVPYMQPKFDGNSGKITGAEISSKWNHPKFGLIEPADFLPVLEMSGNILSLDLYLLEEACKLLQKWVTDGCMPVPLSVMISKFNLYEVGFVEKVMGLIRHYQVPTCLINLEFDETTLLDHEAKALEIMTMFHEREFMLTVNHFGERTVSLDVLCKFPVQVLNLGAGFVERATADTTIQKVLYTVAALARSLNMMISTDGIETKEQETLLKQIECEFWQGELFAGPKPREEFEKLIF